MIFNSSARELICGIAASAAYCDTQQFSHRLNSNPNLCEFESVVLYEHKATHSQMFLAQSPKVVLVAFRGTEINQPQDFVTDARSHLAKRQPYPGRVHRGFAMAVDGIMTQPLEEAAGTFAMVLAEALQTGDRELWLTGHSLGGALATLAAMHCHSSGINVHTVCTFGAPMVGDQAFAKAYDAIFLAKHQRFVNDRDLVPVLPSSPSYCLSVCSAMSGVKLGAYRHVGTLRAVNSELVVAETVTSPFSQLVEPLLDHAYADYVKVLQASYDASIVVPPGGNALLVQATQAVAVDSNAKLHVNYFAPVSCTIS